MMDMTTRELALNVLGVIVFAFIARFPWYFKFWSFGSGGMRSYPKDSPQAFHVRLVASFCLAALLFLDLVLILRALGVEELDRALQVVRSFVDVEKVVSDSKITETFYTLSMINFLWVIWFTFKDKDYRFPLTIKLVAILCALFFLFTTLLIQRSYELYWFCIITNSLFLIVNFSGLLEKKILIRYRKEKNTSNEKTEKIGKKV